MNIVLTTLLTLLLTDAVSAQCPASGGWAPVAGQCMVCVDEPVHWRVARRSCLARGGVLTSIHNGEQRVFVENCARDLGNNEDVWVGTVTGAYDGSDNPVPSTLGWMDGSAYDYPIPIKETGRSSDCFELDAENELSLARCNRDNTYVCSMAFITCQSLGGFANGNVTYSIDGVDGAYNLSTLATYQCNEGHVLSGETARTCEGANTWTTLATFPTCAPVDCGALQSPENGRMTTTGSTYNSVAIFTCNTGYNMSGDNLRSCGADGAWGGEATTCVAVPEEDGLESTLIGLGVAAGFVGLVVAGALTWYLCRGRTPMTPMGAAVPQRLPVRLGYMPPPRPNFPPLFRGPRPLY